MSHYTHITTNEREKLLVLRQKGAGIREIARNLSRSAATISRELRRNNSDEGYWPSIAQQLYAERRKACHRKRILDDPVKRAFVQEKIIKEQWSPEQIDGRTALENNPNHCSYATIYRAIYAGRMETHKLPHGQRGIVLKLRHKGKKRHKKGVEETRGKLNISHSIDERPQAANDRSEIGHLEGDTVAGKQGSACLITCVDRETLFLLMRRSARKTAECVRAEMVKMLSVLPPGLVKTITPDRGKEFAMHREITEALGGVQFYFPPPHAPWARGTNENTNGLIREYFPKSVDLNEFPPEYFDAIALKINLRPRKRLHWKTPFELFFSCVLHLT